MTQKLMPLMAATLLGALLASANTMASQYYQPYNSQAYWNPAPHARMYPVAYRPYSQPSVARLSAPANRTQPSAPAKSTSLAKTQTKTKTSTRADVASAPKAEQSALITELRRTLDFSLSDRHVPRVEIATLPEGFSDIKDAKARKEMFLRMLLPLVLLEQDELLATRARMLKDLDSLQEGSEISEGETKWIKGLARKYRVKSNPIQSAEARDELRRKVDIVPVSLTLAQAANESAWGISRFARQGQNLFGIWTYDESIGIKPKHREAGKKHFVRKFETLRDSVGTYMHTLNSHPAYAKLRDIRSQLRAEGKPLSGDAMAEGLEKYSARGQVYIKALQDIISRNELESLNNVRLTG